MRCVAYARRLFFVGHYSDHVLHAPCRLQVGYTPPAGGVYSISVQLDGIPIAGSPWIVVVEADCPLGTFAAEVTGPCVDCPVSTYSDTRNIADCIACPPFTQVCRLLVDVLVVQSELNIHRLRHARHRDSTVRACKTTTTAMARALRAWCVPWVVVVRVARG